MPPSEVQRLHLLQEAPLRSQGVLRIQEEDLGGPASLLNLHSIIVSGNLSETRSIRKISRQLKMWRQATSGVPYLIWSLIENKLCCFVFRAGLAAEKRKQEKKEKEEAQKAKKYEGVNEGDTPWPEDQQDIPDTQVEEEDGNEDWYGAEEGHEVEEEEKENEPKAKRARG